MVGLVVTILVSAALINGGDNGTDEFIAKQAWLYVSILGTASGTSGGHLWLLLLEVGSFFEAPRASASGAYAVSASVELAGAVVA